MKMNKKEYERLLAKKAKQRLSDEEFAIFKELQARFGNSDSEHKRSESHEGFGPGNDYSWWSKVPELLKDAVNLQSNYIPGYPIDPQEINFNLASVARVSYLPTYGKSRYATDPVNVWARDLYLRMFQKWRGISAYSAADLGIVLIAGVEVVRMIAKLERIYGVINRYSKVNLNMPYTEVEALGLTQAEATYLRDHLSDFRFDLNVLLRKAQRLCIPKDMSIIADQISLMNYEYLDHDNSKAQIIIFDTLYFGVYSDTALTTGGCLMFKKFNLTGATLPILDLTGSGTTMFPGLDLLINSLVGSDSVQRIYGDLVTWFGEGQMLQFVSLPEDYVIVPVKNDTILHKFHNIDPLDDTVHFHSFLRTALPSADVTSLKALNTSSSSQYAIYQVNDEICTEITGCKSSGSTSWHSVSSGEVFMIQSSIDSSVETTVLDTYREAVTPEIITEGMLFKHASIFKKVTDSGTDYYYMDMITYGFEIVNNITIYTLGTNGVVSGMGVSTYNTTGNTAASAAGWLSLWDWAPISYCYTSGIITTLCGDMDTLIPVQPNVKQKAHIAIVYSGLKSDIKVIA